MKKFYNTKISIFSGGSGNLELNKNLYKILGENLTIIINGYDDGKSTGLLREIVPGMLGPSDFRKNIVNLINETNISKKSLKYLLNFRLNSHSLNEIKKIFTFDKIVDDKNLKMIDQISNNNSVSIHIRRGDFLLKKNQNHQTDLTNYYSKAIREISKNNYNLKFFLFTDDPKWVSENFDIKDEKTLVNINYGKNSFIDMHLMSLCKINIIANSSFSWWGAWLNNDNKNVFAPKNWFNDKTINTDDLLPASWIVI